MGSRMGTRYNCGLVSDQVVPLVARFQVVVRPVASVLDYGEQGAAQQQPDDDR